MLGNKEKKMWQQAEKDIRTLKINKVITSLMFVALGAVLLIWPLNALTVVCKAIGLVLAFGGIAGIVLYLVGRSKSFLAISGVTIGVILTVLGLWLFLNPEFLVALVPTIVGLILMISGLINLGEAFTIHRERGTGVLMSVILALLTLGAGALIFANPDAISAFIVKIMGIALIYDGISDLIIISRITGRVREAEQVIHDAQAVDVTEASNKAAGAGASGAQTVVDSTATVVDGAQTTEEKEMEEMDRAYERRMAAEHKDI